MCASELTKTKDLVTRKHFVWTLDANFILQEVGALQQRAVPTATQ